MTHHSVSPRFIELDLWRGLAVLAMVLFHFVFDLSFFLQANVNVYSGFWFWFARAIAGSFIFLAGLSIPLSLHRKKPSSEVAHLTQRALFLLCFGALITLVTYFVFPEYTIWFGVLHAIGVFTLLSILFTKQLHAAFIVGILITILGLAFSLELIPFPAIIGLFPVTFSTFDYFPIFPWFGLFLLGMGISHWAYPHGKPRFPVSISQNSITRFLVWCGRRSLWIYLIHQPILVGIILLVRGM